MKKENNIGKKIKSFREFRKVSREDLASKSNVDLKLLENLEENDQVPSLGQLIKIGRALGVRIGTFLDDQQQAGAVVVRAGEESESISFSTNDTSTREHLNFYSLAQNKPDRHMEPFVISIEPNTESDNKTSSHEGEEFIYVLSGEIRVVYGKDEYDLKTGDSIYYDSIVDHNVYATGSSPAKILAVVYYPM